MAQVESEPVLTMDEENNSKTDDKIKNENLESDLVVSSLFLVVAEPLNVEQKDLIFERIVTGKKSFIVIFKIVFDFKIVLKYRKKTIYLPVNLNFKMI